MEPWQQILADCGYPTEILTLDFESFFSDEYHFRKDAADAVGLSTIEYINDPRFELTGLGLNEAFIKPIEIPGILNTIRWDSLVVVVQNARFDVTVLQTKFGIVPKYIIDVKDLHAHYDASASHKLKDMAKEFGLQAKGETQDFKGLHYDVMTDEQRKALQEYCLNDVDLETKLFKILLPKLSNPVVELRLMRHTLDMWLHRGFDFDRDLADSLKVQMHALIIAAVDKTGLVDENYGRLYNKYFWDGKKNPKRFDGKSDATVDIMIKEEAREAAATDLRGDTFVKLLAAQGEQVEWKEGKGKKKKAIAALAKTDDYAKSLMVHGNPIVRDLMTARMAVKSWPLHTKRITSMEKQSATNGGVLRTPLNYYGGHTGRWSGGEGINLQNLGGKSATTDLLIGKVRGLLRAPKDYVLGIGDSAQIEARVLAWLAGQDDLVEAFRLGKDVYSEFATVLFKLPIRKERKTDPPIIYLMLMIKRAFGKKSILGLGYGMGVDKFYQQCLQDSYLRPFFDNGQYNRQFIQRVVDLYRTKYAKIPAYWRAVETAFKQALRFPHLRPKVGQIEFSCIGHEVHVKLPSGRILYYKQCSIKNGGNISYLAGPKRESLWGGSLTENIDQAISRDLLGFWILACEDAGLPVILSVHDEVVCKINKNNSKISLDKLEQILYSIPEWATGLPVAAEVKESGVYCK